VQRVSHRIAVLRGGRLVAVRAAAGASPAELAELMVGRSVAPAVKRSHAAGAVACTLPGTPLELRAGEIVAIAGVAGNGQQALAERLCGEVAPTGGAVRLDGRPLPASPRAFVDAGVARIPEDRHAVGVIGDLPLWENAALERYATPAFARAGVIRRGAARRAAQQVLERFDVRGGGSVQAVYRRLACGGQAELELGLEALRRDILVANVLEDLAIGNGGRTGGFAGQATDTLGGVKVRPLVLSQPSRGLLAPQTQPTARRVVFIARELVSRTHREAKAAVRAVGEVVGRGGGGME
jgi:ABC-type uncharacterized transport system ATPase subunit